MLLRTQALLSATPGNRAYISALKSFIRALMTTALQDAQLDSFTQRIIPLLVPEFALAIQKASASLIGTEILVELGSDYFVVKGTLLGMIFTDVLLYGYGTFEALPDSIVYADPRQFSSIRLLPDGSVEVKKEGKDLSDRVGVVSRSRHPIQFAHSVPELLPSLFVYLIWLHHRAIYEVSPFRKPDILIMLPSVLGQDTKNKLRQDVFRQMEEEFSSVVVIGREGDTEEKAQLFDIAKASGVLSDTMLQSRYNALIEILESSCGVPSRDGGLLLRQFLAEFSNELYRLYPNSVVRVKLSKELESKLED